jgi:hypothetical protein
LEHFAAVLIDADGTPVPVWKLSVPATVANDIAARRDADDAVGRDHRPPHARAVVGRRGP